MAKDIIGNELHVGDLVQVKLNSPELLGKVIRVSEGGIQLVGGDRQKREMVTPGSVIVRLDANAQFDPATGVCASIVRVVDPNPNPQPDENERKPSSLVV